jgi:hypothetical protein
VRHADHDVRSRVIAPIVLPIVVLLAIAAFVGTIALTLLYSTKSGALMLAAVAAGGILFTISLASSQDKLDGPRKAVVTFAAALPILVGIAFATGFIGGIDDADRMINVQPLVTIPEDAPLIAAENSVEFCLPTDDGGCEPVEEWDVVPSADSDFLTFVFDNREAGVIHNVAFYELEGSEDDPGPGPGIYAGELITGPEILGEMTDIPWEDLPEVFYFNCVVHPNMNGIGRLAEGGDAEA